MLNPEMSLAMSKILSAIKRGEKCKVEVRSNFVPDEDPELLKILKDGPYDETKPLFVHVHMLRLTKIEDWFKDGSTLVRTLRKGKGRNPYTDSTVKLRLKFMVNGKEIVSNYPEYEPIMKSEEEAKDEE